MKLDEQTDVALLKAYYTRLLESGEMWLYLDNAFENAPFHTTWLKTLVALKNLYDQGSLEKFRKWDGEFIDLPVFAQDIFAREWPDARKKLIGIIDDLNIELADTDMANIFIPKQATKQLQEFDRTIERYRKVIAINQKKAAEQKAKAEHNRALLFSTSIAKRGEFKGKLQLESSNYDAANGVLNMFGEQIFIIRQPNKKGTDKESKQAKLMRALFTVKTFPNTVPIRQIYPVKSEVYPPNIIKQANALVAEINERIQEKLPVNRVINHDKFKFYIEDRYLI